MLTEMLGKGGNLCSQARSGQIRCPLIVRPTSRRCDHRPPVPTLELHQSPVVAPRPAQPPLAPSDSANRSFGSLKIDLWQNQPCYPSDSYPGTKAQRRLT